MKYIENKESKQSIVVLKVVKGMYRKTGIRIPLLLNYVNESITRLILECDSHKVQTDNKILWYLVIYYIVTQEY